MDQTTQAGQNSNVLKDDRVVTAMAVLGIVAMIGMGLISSGAFSGIEGQIVNSNSGSAAEEVTISQSNIGGVAYAVGAIDGKSAAALGLGTAGAGAIITGLEMASIIAASTAGVGLVVVGSVAL